MRTKLFVLLMVCVLSAVALLGAACSGSGSGSAASAPTAEGQGTVSGPNSPGAPGAIVPNFLMTFQGVGYRLTQVLQADQVDGSAFTAIGQASQMDAPGDPTVYTRQGDENSVYTFFKGTGEAADGPQDSWYRWERAQQ